MPFKGVEAAVTGKSLRCKLPPLEHTVKLLFCNCQCTFPRVHRDITASNVLQSIGEHSNLFFLLLLLSLFLGKQYTEKQNSCSTFELEKETWQNNKIKLQEPISSQFHFTFGQQFIYSTIHFFLLLIYCLLCIL